MSQLVNHANVYLSCLALLERNGWELRIVPGPYEQKDASLDTYSASRDGTTILADNPLELLGLANLHQYHHPHGDEPYWWTIEPVDPNLREKLELAAMEDGLADLKRRDEALWRTTVRDALREAVGDPTVSASDRLGISPEHLQELLARDPTLDGSGASEVSPATEQTGEDWCAD